MTSLPVKTDLAMTNIIFGKNVPKYAQKLEKPYQYIDISKLKVLSFQSPMPDLFKTEIYGLEVMIRELGLRNLCSVLTLLCWPQ